MTIVDGAANDYQACCTVVGDYFISHGGLQALDFLEQLLVYDPKRRLLATDAAAVSRPSCTVLCVLNDVCHMTCVKAILHAEECKLHDHASAYSFVVLSFE